MQVVKSKWIIVPFFYQKIWGVFWACSRCVGLIHLLKKSWVYSGRVVFAFILKKNWGVFRACFGRGSKASSESKGITGMAPLINGVCSGCYSSIIYQQIWGVFWACSGCVVFASFKKKILGVFWACSGCFFLLQFLKKTGACSVCSSVFSVLFLVTQNLIS